MSSALIMPKIVRSKLQSQVRTATGPPYAVHRRRPTPGTVYTDRTSQHRETTHRCRRISHQVFALTAVSVPACRLPRVPPTNDNVCPRRRLAHAHAQRYFGTSALRLSFVTSAQPLRPPSTSSPTPAASAPGQHCHTTHWALFLAIAEALPLPQQLHRHTSQPRT